MPSTVFACWALLEVHQWDDSGGLRRVVDRKVLLVLCDFEPVDVHVQTGFDLRSGMANECAVDRR